MRDLIKLIEDIQNVDSGPAAAAQAVMTHAKDAAAREGELGWGETEEARMNAFIDRTIEQLQAMGYKTRADRSKFNITRPDNR
jgi:hypothetical protein